MDFQEILEEFFSQNDLKLLQISYFKFSERIYIKEIFIIQKENSESGSDSSSSSSMSSALHSWQNQSPSGISPSWMSGSQVVWQQRNLP